MREVRWDTWLGRAQQINGSDSPKQSWIFYDNCLTTGLLRLLSVLNWLTARLFAVSLALLFLYGLSISNGTYWLRNNVNLMCYRFDCLCGTGFACSGGAVTPIMQIQFKDLIACVVILTCQLERFPKDVFSIRDLLAAMLLLIILL
jgi:hypothetical protein